MSSIWGSWWHHLDSNRFRWHCPSISIDVPQLCLLSTQYQQLSSVNATHFWYLQYPGVSCNFDFITSCTAYSRATHRKTKPTAHHPTQWLFWSFLESPCSCILHASVKQDHLNVTKFAFCSSYSFVLWDSGSRSLPILHSWTWERALLSGHSPPTPHAIPDSLEVLPPCTPLSGKISFSQFQSWVIRFITPVSPFLGTSCLY